MCSLAMEWSSGLCSKAQTSKSSAVPCTCCSGPMVVGSPHCSRCWAAWSLPAQAASSWTSPRGSCSRTPTTRWSCPQWQQTWRSGWAGTTWRRATWQPRCRPRCAWSTWSPSCTAPRTRCRAGSASAWPSRVRWPRAPPSCCWTSSPRSWTWRTSAGCWPRCAASRTRAPPSRPWQPPRTARGRPPRPLRPPPPVAAGRGVLRQTRAPTPR
mmetsp:Transcript_2459/g.6316  ORF Transcript_2459/g.6316 Transcript_2459/m.6316 type:complete len:211 (-) Transcript_2459:449-1081(-)